MVFFEKNVQIKKKLLIFKSKKVFHSFCIEKCQFWLKNVYL